MTQVNGDDLALSADDLGKTAKEIAQAGWMVVLPGELYYALTELVARMKDSAVSHNDVATVAFLREVQGALLSQAKPVKARMVSTPAIVTP